MSKHYSKAQWEGNLREGKGKYFLKTSGYEGNVKFSSRFEDDKSASSPEELIGAALASCFSMALAHALDQAGYKPERIETSAEVTLGRADSGFAISEILLNTKGTVQGLEDAKFQKIAEETKTGCPVSKALTGTKIRLEAKLFSPAMREKG
ncbi:MAG: OsmC family peroxiredoxin [Methanococcaceae archaeon]